MSQSFTDDCFSAGIQAGLSLQEFEDNFAALKSLFEGPEAPPNVVRGMPWFDSTKKLPKVRNYANDAWLGIMAADAQHKIWVYRNTAPDGWAIDASVADVVIALKGGTQAYNHAGGTTQGTWVQPDHTLTTAELPALSISGSFTGIEGGHGPSAGATGIPTNEFNESAIQVNVPVTVTVSTGGAAHNHGSTYRPAAAIGTLQYMDI